jgi:hypothetical protein
LLLSFSENQIQQACQHGEVMAVLHQVLDAVQDTAPRAAAAIAAIRPGTPLAVASGGEEMSKSLQKELKAAITIAILGSTFCETPTENTLNFPCFQTR